MSVGGTGIPRLQSLSYIEIAATQVAAGATFNQIRANLVGHAAGLARQSDWDGSFDEQRWDRLRRDKQKYVYNTVDVLKELTRLGWMDKQVLPSTAESSYQYVDSTFELTEAGRAWVDLVAFDKPAAYNQLLGLLATAHPHFRDFLDVVGAMPYSRNTNFTVPLLKPTAAQHPTNDAYLHALIEYVDTAQGSGTLGWSADRDTIDRGVRTYVHKIAARLQGRKQKQLTRKQFVSVCEEAVTKVAFMSAGSSMDYISMELIRRWTRTLGIANFSYYAPGPYALRLWATGTVSGAPPEVTVSRRVGPEIRAEALRTMWNEWQQLRAADPTTGMYQPVWRVRAAVCWRLRINDDQFDQAIAEALGHQHPELPFQIHLDQASGQATPSSTRPLILPRTTGLPIVYNVLGLVPTTNTTGKETT